jgi:hypothetical protein
LVQPKEYAGNHQNFRAAPRGRLDYITIVELHRDSRRLDIAARANDFHVSLNTIDLSGIIFEAANLDNV